MNSYCVLKGSDNSSTIYSFFSNDKAQRKKSLTLKQDHHNANIDAIFLGKMPDNDEGLNVENAKLGVLSLTQHH